MACDQHQLVVRLDLLEGDDATYAQLTHLTQQTTAWTDLPALAEAQSLAPLLYHHLQAAGVSLPLPVKRDLQGLTLRHRHANEVRRRVLVEILAAFQAAGIEARVLKGAALAFLVYPEPGLRPMRDIDLLVKKADGLRAQQVLAALGFSVPCRS